jgi:hypothetical protein
MPPANKTKIRRALTSIAEIVTRVHAVIPTKNDTAVGAGLKLLSIPHHLEAWWTKQSMEEYVYPSEYGYVVTRSVILAHALHSTNIGADFTWNVKPVGTSSRVHIGTHKTTQAKLIYSMMQKDDNQWFVEARIVHHPSVDTTALLGRIWPSYGNLVNVRQHPDYPENFVLESHTPPPSLIDEGVLDELDAETHAGRILLLWGPPGTGKSSLCLHLAMRRKVSMLRVAHLIQDGLPAVCATLAPALLVVEDIDRQRTSNVAAFLDMLESAPVWAKNTAVILTANDPTLLPFAALRPARIDWTIQVKLPKRHERDAIFLRYGVEASKEVLDQSEGWTGSFIREFAEACKRNTDQAKALTALNQLLSLQKLARMREEEHSGARQLLAEGHESYEKERRSWEHKLFEI